MLASYISATQFSVSGDHTTEFIEGRRVRVLILGVYYYSNVVSSSYTAPVTTVVISESILTSNLTEVHYGIVNIGSQGSLPEHSHTSSEGQGGSLSDTYSVTTHNHDSDYADISHNHNDIYSMLSHSHTFVSLSGTPSAYEAGKYLTSTTSGTQWSYNRILSVEFKEELSGGLVNETWSDNTGDLNGGFIEDTTLFHDNQSANYSTNASFWLAKYAYADYRHPLIKFKMKDIIGGSNIVSAVFKFYMTSDLPTDMYLPVCRIFG